MKLTLLEATLSLILFIGLVLSAYLYGMKRGSRITARMIYDSIDEDDYKEEECDCLQCRNSGAVIRPINA